MLKVNSKKCIGCGTCIALYPECFQLDDKGKAYIVDNSKFDDKDKIKIIIDSCPVKAITNK